MSTLCRFCGRPEAELGAIVDDDTIGLCRRSSAVSAWMRGDGDFAATTAHQDACDMLSPTPPAAPLR